MAPHTRAASRVATDNQGPTKPRVLVVFDFDESLVDEDSDVFFLKSLHPKLLMEMLSSLEAAATTQPHSATADYALGLFHERMPDVTRDQIRNTAARVPVSSKMLDAVKLAVDEHNATVVIASDANDFFIRSMLQLHNMTEYVSEIHANKAKWDTAKSARLRVKPYHAKAKKPHGCERCPSNLCKGQIIDVLRKKNAFDAVLYVGDGTGDYCPCTRLTSRDTVFARADDAKGKSFGLLKKIKEAPHKVEAQVIEWHAGDDIYEHFQKTLAAATVA